MIRRPSVGCLTPRNPPPNHSQTLTADYQVNPFPLGEASARLIAHAFTRGRVPPLPPLLRASDRPGEIKIGAPNEFDNQDNWLAAIGEGREDGGREGGWPASSEATRSARINALKMRKAELGY